VCTCVVLWQHPVDVFGVPQLDGLLTISSKTIQTRIRTGALV